MKSILILFLCAQSLAFAQLTDTIDVTLPRSVEEAHDRLMSLLPDSVITRMKNRTEEDMILYHFGLGMWIRNNWGLWKHTSGLALFFDSVGVRHPDEMSGIILETFWCRLNKQPLLLPERIEQSIQRSERFRTSYNFLDSTCAEDGTGFQIKDLLEKLGPPYQYCILIECKKHHLWVFEKGRPLYKPDERLLADFASEKWEPRGVVKPNIKPPKSARRKRK